MLIACYRPCMDISSLSSNNVRCTDRQLPLKLSGLGNSIFFVSTFWHSCTGIL